MPIDIDKLAPWVAIAITLILSILIPVFSQIANNRFQLKMYRQQTTEETTKKYVSKRIEAYEGFVKNVGVCLGDHVQETIGQAVASIGGVYMYVAEEWWGDLDALCEKLRKHKTDEATILYIKLNKLMASELNKQSTGLKSMRKTMREFCTRKLQSNK